MANEFEHELAKLDAIEDRVEKGEIDDGKFNKLMTIRERVASLLIARNVANQTEAKKLAILTKPENAEILGKENIQLYFRQMLPPPKKDDGSGGSAPPAAARAA